MANKLQELGVEVASVPRKSPPLDISAYLPDKIGMQAILATALAIWAAYMLFAMLKARKSG